MDLRMYDRNRLGMCVPLSRGLGCQLFPGCLTTGGLASCLLSTGHDEVFIWMFSRIVTETLAGWDLYRLGI